MSVISAASRPRLAGGDAALRLAASFWFLVALAGQWLFTAYLVKFYGGALASLELEAINAKQTITGYVQGDPVGNAFLLSHVLLGALISFAGMLQLIPQLRRRAPLFHRWNGRVFLAVSLVAAATGLWLTWGRGSRLSDAGALGVTLNGILILIAVPVAWQLARRGRIAAHRRWAIRAFLLVSGVWTFRLALMGWLVANQGPQGNSPTLDGPMDQVLSFGSYLLPLAIAELYFRAGRRGTAGGKRIAAGILAGSTLLMAFGIFAAWMILWRPHF